MGDHARACLDGVHDRGVFYGQRKELDPGKSSAYPPPTHPSVNIYLQVKARPVGCTKNSTITTSTTTNQSTYIRTRPPISHKDGHGSPLRKPATESPANVTPHPRLPVSAAQHHYGHTRHGTCVIYTRHKQNTRGVSPPLLPVSCLSVCLSWGLRVSRTWPSS